MRPSTLLTPIVSLLLATGTCFAQLTWKEQEARLDIDSSQSTGSATFEFVNNSGGVIRITDIKPGCGCTVPTLEKREYAAGESGQFTVRFSIGERRGYYAVPITVAYENGGTDSLTLKTNIRELVKFFPPQLVWNAGEQRSPKEVEFHWAESDPVSISAIRSTNEAFKAELVSDHDWHGARLRISPSSDEAKGVSVIVITTAQGPGRRARTYTVVARGL